MWLTAQVFTKPLDFHMESIKPLLGHKLIVQVWTVFNLLQFGTISFCM